MKRSLCRLCWGRHYTHEGHKLDKAINNAINAAPSAINKSLPPRAIRVEPQPDVDKELQPTAVEATVVGDKTPNRRTREAYNEYMKGYMAKRRRSLPTRNVGV